MDNNNLNGHHLGSRITPEMLGLVKKSAVEKKISINLVDVIAGKNSDKIENEFKQNGNSKPKEDDDIEIVDEIVTKKLKLENDSDCVVVKKEDENNDQKVKTNIVELDDEETGFPNYLNGWVIRGRTIPINKKTWTEIDIDGNDAILDCPSQVVPLMIKKPNVFPVKEETKSIKSEVKSEIKKEIKEEIKEKNKDEIKKEPVKEEEKKKDVLDKEEKKNDENNKANDQTSEAEKKPNVEKNLPSSNKDNKLTMLTIPDFYKSSVGSFLMGIGLRRCQEVFLKDSVRQTQKLIRKEGELEEHLETLKDQQEQYEDCKSVNSIYTFRNFKCSMCDFKTESELIMQGHLSIPHISNRKEFKCNFCMFVTRDARTIVYHFLDQHKKPCNIELPPQLYTCPTCNYESNQKAKAANHMAKCVKVFNGDKVQQTLDIENEFPTITPKPITQDDLKLYETTIQALKPVVMNPGLQIPYVPGLPRGLQQQILLMQQQQFARQKIKQPKALVSQRNNINNIRPNNLANMANILNSQTAIAALAASGANGANLLNNLNFAKANAPQLYHMLQTGSHAQLLNLPAKQNILPSSSKIPHMNSRTVPPISSATMIQKNINNIRPTLLGKNFKETNNGGKPETFVICEICDGYIKDLEQLRTHMQWIHKVKIHPKMLASRPPLNCQKCQWRFFTDQGLERHLLGAHGLVTTNMQDLVDQFEDGGRCTICGRAFTSKLVAHMNQVHKVTLRPAHLSYKCTVCSATFNLYRLFENHVYMVHSGSVKRINDDQANQLNKKSRTQTIEIKSTAINGS